MEKSAPRVLLVDDDSDIVELLKYNLVKEGYEVLGITDPQHVLAAIAEFHPGIVIMDIMMPGKDGFQICAEIRLSPQGQDLVIFFITNGEERLHQVALQSGGDDFIQKFSGLRTLIERTNLVLKRKLVIRKRVRNLTVGPLQLDREHLTARNRNSELVLSNFEFDVLFFLAQNVTRSIPIKVLNAIVNEKDVFKQNFLIQSLHRLIKKVGCDLIAFTPEHRVMMRSAPLK